MLSCDLGKKGEPNNWGAKGNSCIENKLNFISLYFRSIFDWRKLCGKYIQQVFIIQPPACKKTPAEYLQAVFESSIYSSLGMDKILPRRKFTFGYFLHEIMTCESFTKFATKVLWKDDTALEGENKKVLSSRKMASSFFQYWDSWSIMCQCWAWVWDKN